MEALFGALSVVGGFISLLMIVFALIKKNKSMRNKSIFGLVSCLVVFMFAVGNTKTETTNTASEPTQEKKTETVKEETTPVVTTNTNTNTNANSEYSYKLRMQTHAKKVSVAMRDFGNVFMTPKLGDDEWTLKASTAITSVKIIASTLPEADAPDSLKESDRLYRQAMSKYVEAMDMVPNAVDSLDIDKINRAGAIIKEGTALINQIDWKS